MDRRELLAGMSLAAAPFCRAQGAQTPQKALGWLSYTDWAESDMIAETMAALARVGWARGGNLSVHRRAPIVASEITPFAEELAQLRPDLVVASGEAGSLAVTAVAPKLPLLFYDTFDPVRAGLVSSFARPGGHATGFVGHPPTLGARWVQLLQEIVPDLRRIGLILEPAIPSSLLFVAVIRSFAGPLGIEVALWPATRRDRVLEEMRAFGSASSAVIMIPDPVVLRSRREFTQAAVQAKVPTMSWSTAAVTGGLLMAYGPNRSDLPGKLATTIDRLLRGTPPGEMPVEEPVRYELAINMPVARALGLPISPALLARADLVVE